MVAYWVYALVMRRCTETLHGTRGYRVIKNRIDDGVRIPDYPLRKNNLEEKIESVAASYRSFDQMYDDILKDGIKTCQLLLDNDGVWKRLELKFLLEEFEKQELFEKCVIIRDLIDSEDYVASKEKAQELNKKLKKLLV